MSRLSSQLRLRQGALTLVLCLYSAIVALAQPTSLVKMANDTGRVAQPARHIAPDGFVEIETSSDPTTDEERRPEQSIIELNLADLSARGLLNKVEGTARVLLGWPLKAAPTLTDPGYHTVSAYVNHYPERDLGIDYQCGVHSADGHPATIYHIWPFGWHKVDHDQVQVIAAAAGVIVFKKDGFPDRCCGNECGPSQPWNTVGINQLTSNTVGVHHSDGLITLYRRMKSGSLTAKQVGDTVEHGEYLGVVANSGGGHGPSLAFEARWALNGRVIDPYAGPCNRLNRMATMSDDSLSWWIEQRPYLDRGLNALWTHGRPPTPRQCPEAADLNLQNEFAHGDTVVVAAYLRNPRLGDTISLRILNPSQSEWQSWNYEIPYGGEGLGPYWKWILPDDVRRGEWRIEANYLGVDYSQNFTVGVVTATEGDASLPTEFALHQNYPNPFDPDGLGTTIWIDLPERAVITLAVYDILGQEVLRLESGNVLAGRHQYEVNASTLPSGVYLYRLETPLFAQSRRMMLLK